MNTIDLCRLMTTLYVICVVLFAFERCVLCPSTIAQRSTSCPWASSLTVGWVWQTCGRRTLREIKSCDWWWLLANQWVVLGTILFHWRVWPKPFLSIVGSSLSFNPKNCADEEICLWHPWYTSSTAQGGGGSFKNRKPIGEIGCCESGMAERIHWWTERCLRSPLFLSLSLTIYPATNLSSMYLSICLSIYLSVCLSVDLSICGAVSFSVM